ncbi:MAG: butyrate kinase [Peptostreptococcaceae bacterium]|nr:butyrate kinase [Peptostreptococcaceae bacterium]
MNILVINPGSTTTKIAVYDGNENIFTETIEHPVELIGQFSYITDQFSMRRKSVKEILDKHNVDESKLVAIISRGGLLFGLKAGGYKINEALVEAFKSDKASPHASNLGAMIAYDIAEPLGIPSYIYDSEASDELEEIARITGMKGYRYKPLAHVLNQKAVARKVAKEKFGKEYSEIRTVVAHMGGGITVGAHRDGRIVDSVRDDDGPFSPERSGGIPLLDFIDICAESNYTKNEMIKMVRGDAGIKVLLGTTDMRLVEKQAENGEEEAKLIYSAMAYKVAKAIGGMATVLNCDLDCIILTGGIAYSSFINDIITDMVKAIAPVVVVPGEYEMQALASGAVRILSGKEEAKTY